MTYAGVVSITNTGTTSGSTHVMVDGVKMDGGKITTADAIEAAALATDSVTADAIAAGAVGASEIATDAVNADEIAAGAVGTSEIAADAVTNAKIATDAVNADSIAADAVGASEIADNVVNAYHMYFTEVTGCDYDCSSCTSSACNTASELGSVCLSYDNCNTCYYRHCVCLRRHTGTNSGYGWFQTAISSFSC